MSERDLIEPHAGDKRYQRRKSDGTFGEIDDQTRSLRADAARHASYKKPKNLDDMGDWVVRRSSSAQVSCAGPNLCFSNIGFTLMDAKTGSRRWSARARGCSQADYRRFTACVEAAAAARERLGAAALERRKCRAIVFGVSDEARVHELAVTKARLAVTISR